MQNDILFQAKGEHKAANNLRTAGFSHHTLFGLIKADKSLLVYIRAPIRFEILKMYYCS